MQHVCRYHSGLLIICIILFISISASAYRFAYDEDNDIIIDTLNDRQWKIAPYSNSCTRVEANEWCRNLEGNWYLPSVALLNDLYWSGITARDWGYFDINLNGSSMSFVWSSDRGTSTDFLVKAYDFASGQASEVYSNVEYACRVFAVRRTPGDINRFVEYDDSFLDTVTGFEWMVYEISPCTWTEAEIYINSIGNGWRMPTNNQYMELYEATIGIESEGPLGEVKNTFWSCTTEGLRDPSVAFVFCMSFGSSFVFRIDRDVASVCVIR